MVGDLMDGGDGMVEPLQEQEDRGPISGELFPEEDEALSAIEDKLKTMASMMTIKPRTANIIFLDG